MADPWELILHHSYAGTPGVVFDQSPGRGAHGRAIRISDDQFLPDGTESGSGVIDFRSGGFVRAACSGPWRRVEGMRAEVACLGDPDLGGNLISGDTFSFSVGSGLLTFYTTGDGVPFSDIVYSAPISLDLANWTTLGFIHDGFSRVILTQDGVPIFDKTALNIRMGRTRTLTVGATAGVDPRSFNGLIDDVKIWRINPHRVDNEFVNRPMGPTARDCWRRWTDALAVATRNDPDCMRRIVKEIAEAKRSVQLEGNTTSATTRRAWNRAAEDYRSLWSQGDLSGIVPVVSELVNTLGVAGIDPSDNAAVRRLLADPCIESIVGQLPSLDCDPDFTGLIGDLGAALADPGHVS